MAAERVEGVGPDGFHHLPVRVYYEDTDCTGVVYHSNYLKYFERSREHLLGPEGLVDLFETSGRSFVVTTVTINFKQGAKYGDELEVRTRPAATSSYRLEFDQQVWNITTGQQVIAGTVQMVCVKRDLSLCELPSETVEGIAAKYPPREEPAARPRPGSGAKKQKPRRNKPKGDEPVPVPHLFDLEVYYEDTDFTGVVYYANYLKFMERARSNLAGIQRVASSEKPDDQALAAGLRVYKAQLTYKAGAKHGDLLQVRTTVETESAYRLVFRQDVFRVECHGSDSSGKELLLVSGLVELICIDPATSAPTKFPRAVLEAIVGNQTPATR